VEQQRGLHNGDTPTSLSALEADLVECRLCPRLVAWREEVAETKRAAFASDDYWGKPVPGFGDPRARIVVVGLAPAAHGANRTGRMFTGDRSGEWLYRSLHNVGLASQPLSVSIGDGMVLTDAWITAPVRCAPPQNKPTPTERDNCSYWMDAEIALLPEATVFVALGQIGYHALWAHFARTGRSLPRPRPSFAHGIEIELDGVSVLASYHVSQQNTFTGRLTAAMLDAVLSRAVQIAAG
jgi:uracil-DNA glycosylase family 4